MYKARRTVSKALLVAPLLIPGSAMPTENSPRNPGEGWRALLRKNGTAEFAAAFAPNAVLDTSVMNKSLIGVEAIGSFFAATSGGMYDSLAFTNETVDG